MSTLPSPATEIPISLFVMVLSTMRSIADEEPEIPYLKQGIKDKMIHFLSVHQWKIFTIAAFIWFVLIVLFILWLSGVFDDKKLESDNTSPFTNIRFVRKNQL